MTTIDLSTMTDDELRALIDAATAQLESRLGPVTTLEEWLRRHEAVTPASWPLRVLTSARRAPRGRRSPTWAFDVSHLDGLRGVLVVLIGYDEAREQIVDVWFVPVEALPKWVVEISDSPRAPRWSTWRGVSGLRRALRAGAPRRSTSAPKRP